MEMQGETSGQEKRDKRRVRRKRYNQPPCMMCVVYQTAPQKEKTKGVKFCKPAGKWVAETDFCKGFEPALYFYCNEYECYLNAEVCLHRRTPKCKYGGYYDTCKKCDAGFNLHYYETGIEIPIIVEGRPNEDGTEAE